MAHRAGPRNVVAVERTDSQGNAVVRGEVIDRTATSAKVQRHENRIERVHFDDKDLRFLTADEP